MSKVEVQCGHTVYRLVRGADEGELTDYGLTAILLSGRDIFYGCAEQRPKTGEQIDVFRVARAEKEEAETARVHFDGVEGEEEEDDEEDDDEEGDDDGDEEDDGEPVEA